jgi:hypothetical protein
MKLQGLFPPEESGFPARATQWPTQGEQALFPKPLIFLRTVIACASRRTHIAYPTAQRHEDYHHIEASVRCRRGNRLISDRLMPSVSCEASRLFEGQPWIAREQ